METGVRESTALYYAIQERLIRKYPLISAGLDEPPGARASGRLPTSIRPPRT